MGRPGQRALPEMVFGERPVLQRAATAVTEMFAERFNAFVAGLFDSDQAPAIRMAGDRLDHDHFAWQRIRHVDRPV